MPSARPLRTRAVAALAVFGTTAAVAVALAPEAQAAPLKVTYDATGSTVVAKTNSSVALGPTTLKASVKPSGAFTATLKLPPSSASFKLLGLLPATATVSFVSTGKLTGQLASSATGTTISSTASYFIKLSDVKVAGIPAFVGDSCQTADPVSIPISGPFSITDGGTVTGTYTIGNFANCGLTTGLLNLLIPGSGNTVSFTLSNGRLG